MRQAFIDRQPMGTGSASQEEIAAIAVYLASDEHFATGQAYIVDGGFAM